MSDAALSRGSRRPRIWACYHTSPGDPGLEGCEVIQGARGGCPGGQHHHPTAAAFGHSSCPGAEGHFDLKENFQWQEFKLEVNLTFCFLHTQALLQLPETMATMWLF